MKPPPVPNEERVIRTVFVTATALNVRREASTDAAIVTQAKRGERLGVLAEGESWMRVHLANGESGWVASRFVSDEAARRGSAPRRARSGCPADSDYAFVETPTLSHSESNRHGLVVVEANVNASGFVTSTKIVSNSTGDEALAAAAQREIRSAKFSPPIRSCVPRAFIFTYRRTF